MLREDGFELIGPDLDGYAHRYERDGLIIDVLAPDGIKPPPGLGAGRKAVGVPGGSQALSRSETVSVTVNGRLFELRRPTLLGVVLIKARSLMIYSDPETQREDLLQLLALIEDLARRPRSSVRPSAPGSEPPSSASTPPGRARSNAETMRRAALAYRLLVRSP
jgi:hypothetical protein